MLPPVARRFVAGETTAGALQRASDLNERNVGAILNLLGEHYDARAPADEDTAAYVQLIEDVAAADLHACVSVKPSQLGLDLGETVFRENLGAIVGRAWDRDVFVWLDMEDHTTTDATLDAFEYHAREHGGGVGVCLQSNLRRTREDLRRLARLPGKVRLVKGAYDPPPAVAYKGSRRINERYRGDLEYVFEHFEDGIAVGSHDPDVLELAESLHAEYGTPYEVQMLMGVREDALFDLAAHVPAWQYVPYGDRWLSYFWRRVIERKENALFALRAVLGR